MITSGACFTRNLARPLWHARPENRASDRLSLLDQLDYRGNLTRQFRTRTHRIVDTGSGMYLAAARIDDPRAVIEHKLSWGPVSGPDDRRPGV